MLIQVAEADFLQRAEALWVEKALAAIAERGVFHVALSGGGTPARLYRRLVENPDLGDQWGRIHLWFGDERCVLPDHSLSNYRMVREAGLTTRPGVTVERMPGEQSPMEAAVAYAGRLRQLPGVNDGLPQFDLVMLGMGEDGHVASLFPNSDNLRERQRWVSAAFINQVGRWRLSITMPVIGAAREILLLVSGKAKAELLPRVFQERNPAFPASEVAAMPQVTWLVDEAAAAKLRL
jgi:6-phosphogluconolactonase